MHWTRIITICLYDPNASEWKPRVHVLTAMLDYFGWIPLVWSGSYSLEWLIVIMLFEREYNAERVRHVQAEKPSGKMVFCRATILTIT